MFKEIIEKAEAMSHSTEKMGISGISHHFLRSVLNPLADSETVESYIGCMLGYLNPRELWESSSEDEREQLNKCAAIHVKIGQAMSQYSPQDLYDEEIRTRLIGEIATITGLKTSKVAFSIGANGVTPYIPM